MTVRHRKTLGQLFLQVDDSFPQFIFPTPRPTECSASINRHGHMEKTKDIETAKIETVKCTKIAGLWIICPSRQ